MSHYIFYRISQEEFLEACKSGNLENVKSTLEKLKIEGNDVNAQDAEGRSGLWLAASKGHLSVLEFLVSEGANVDATNNERKTALMIASFNGHMSVCEYLISQNCDVLIQCKAETALDYAIDGKNEEIVALLKSFQ